MQASECYSSYPLWIVLVSSVHALGIYVLGALVLSSLTIWLVVPYLLLCLWLEVQVLRKSCRNCAYYGETCGLGKGRLCTLLFARGDPARFVDRKVTWADMLPDLLVVLLPLAGGILSLILHFSWAILLLLLALLGLSFAGNGLIRGSLVCKHCQQAELGCPALGLFGGGARE
jgi:mannose/fructose/N-acetylgalactosamine-specific phosphotransferase system component IID